MKYDPLWEVIPESEKDRIMSQYRCELDYEFLGFTDIYIALSHIIPKEFTIIDFGCYLAAQCYCFSEHYKYIGVDVVDMERFSQPNTKHYVMTIQDFIQKHKEMSPNEATFAICSYVPDFCAAELVRANYKNVFAYYPSSDRTTLMRRPN